MQGLGTLPIAGCFDLSGQLENGGDPPSGLKMGRGKQKLRFVVEYSLMNRDTNLWS